MKIAQTLVTKLFYKPDTGTHLNNIHPLACRTTHMDTNSVTHTHAHTHTHTHSHTHTKCQLQPVAHTRIVQVGRATRAKE